MNIPELDLTQVSFHDAGLTKLVHSRGVVTLVLENLCFADALRHAQLRIEGVDSATRNGVAIVDLQMEEKDGEVLTLRREGDQVLLAIQWDNFVTKKHEVVAYNLSGPNIALHLIKYQSSE